MGVYLREALAMASQPTSCDRPGEEAGTGEWTLFLGILRLAMGGSSQRVVKSSLSAL